MGISVYLSNDNVQIIEGDTSKNQIVIQKIYNVRIPEGAMLNGVIISDYLFGEAIQSIWEKFHLQKTGIRLVIESTQFFTRVVTVPKQNDKKMLETIKKEFSEIEQQDKYLFDYRIIEENKKTGLCQVICSAAGMDFIKSYVDFFKEKQIVIEGIDVALNAQLKVYEKIEGITEHTFITSILDGNNLINTLIVQGKFKYTSRSRLFSDAGTEDFGLEMARTISSIMQFHSAEKIEQKIEAVYLGGFDENNYEICSSLISELGLGVERTVHEQAARMPEKEVVYSDYDLAGDQVMLIDYTYSAGGLDVLKKDLNYVKRYQLQQKSEKSVNVPWKAFLPAGIVVAVGLVASIVLIVMNVLQDGKLDEANSYLVNDVNIQKYDEIKGLEAEADLQDRSIETGKLAWKVKESYPVADSLVEQAVQQCAGDKVSITVDSYEAATGTYQFTAMAAQVTDIYDFISQLKETGQFADLEYSGYNFTESTAQYDIHVSGYLSESAGKQGE